jgi:exoribonuclease-2
MTHDEITQGALVFYKQRAAQVTNCSKKIDILLENGKTVSVREKDVQLLHPGPVKSLKQVVSASEVLEGELEEACSMLSGEQTDVAEFSELAYESWKPESALAVARLLEEGFYLTGSLWAITVRPESELQAIREEQMRKEAEQAQWEEFLSRVRSRNLQPEDKERFFDVENLAYGHSSSSRLLKSLGIKEEPEHAHELLLKLGIWDIYTDPNPRRYGIPIDISVQDKDEFHIPDDQTRRDLTSLESFAIDDEGSRDPDDAVSIDGNTIWVHIADAAAVVRPGSREDEQARERGVTHYLPQGTVTMLDQRLTDALALGLQEVSPALSVRIDLDEQANIVNTEICTSWIRATRLSYAWVHDHMDEKPFSRMAELLGLYEQRRKDSGSVDINLPEVKVLYEKGKGVTIQQLTAFESKHLVQNAMILAGEAVSTFANTHDIPFPYAVQMPPEGEIITDPDDLAGMFASVRKMRPSEIRMSPDVHAGLGLDSYSRVTSPLRRYIDLLSHQQLRAYLEGGPLLDEQELSMRAQQAFELSRTAAQAERASAFHWKLVYLYEHPNWKGEAVVLAVRKQGVQFVIPELAFETFVSGLSGFEPGQRVMLSCEHVDIPFGNSSWTTVT